MSHRAPWWAVVALVLPAVLVGCSRTEEAADPATLRAYAKTYVELLDESDEKGLATHLANPAQPQDAAARIAALGSRSWRLVDVTSSELSPRAFVLSMSVKGAGEPVAAQTWTENVNWSKDHWVMGPMDTGSAGSASGAATGAATASPPE